MCCVSYCVNNTVHTNLEILKTKPFRGSKILKYWVGKYHNIIVKMKVYAKSKENYRNHLICFYILFLYKFICLVNFEKLI